MVSSDIESTDLFDFSKVCVDIDSQERKEEYYRGLLEARDIAEKALARTLSDASQDQIRNSLDAQLRFAEVSGGKRFLLDSWVRLGYHIKTKVIPAVIVGALALTGYVGKNMYESHALVVAERASERAVLDIVGEREGLLAKTDALRQDPASARLPPLVREEFDRNISDAVGTITPSDSFFGQYHDAASIDHGITTSNHQGILKEARAHEAAFAAATPFLAAAQANLQRQTQLDRIASQIASYESEIPTFSDTPTLRKSAESAVATATAALQRRDLDTAAAAIAALKRAEETHQQFTTLRTKIENTYTAITSAGCPASATQPADRIYRELNSAIANGDVERMEQSGQQLVDFSTQLLSNYELRVVGGIWIYQGNDRSQRSSYAKVQAVDGQPLRLPIQDDDRGGIVTSTPMWGEMVPDTVYEAIKSDKMDNGIIDNAVMGHKDRCSTTPAYDYRINLSDGRTFVLSSSAGRITPIHPDGDLKAESNWRN